MTIWILAAAGLAALAPQGPILLQEERVRAELLQDMDFGTIQAGPEGGSVILSPEGVRRCTGDVREGSTPAATARFRLQGPPHAAFTAKVTPETLYLNPPHTRLLVHDLKADLTEWQGRFDAAGYAELRLGGTLDVGAQPRSGRYVEPHARLHLHVDGAPAFSTPFQLRVRIQPLLMLQEEAPLDFGAWLARGPGRVVVSPEGAWESPDQGGPLYAGGSPAAARFVLRGPAEAWYSIQLPAQVQLQGPAASMEAAHFTCSTALTGLLGEQPLRFRIGASLTVGARQVPGRYWGTYTLTVCYQ